jgi:3-oxoacyl-[acyl-carrier-protein] synthase-3
MAFLNYSSYKISGICTAVPPNIRKSSDFTDRLGEHGVEKFIKAVGVFQGHISEDHMTTSDLCFRAADTLLNRLGIDRSTIDVLLFVSQTPDYVAPSTACVLQHRLGLANSCLSYDINLACSGFVYGISAALGYINTQGINRVLLLCGDTVSKHCSPDDKSLTMLSADAGSAILLEYDENSKDLAQFSLKTIGDGYRSLIVPYGGYRHRYGSFVRTIREQGVVRNDYDGYMNGADVFRFSITEVPKLIKEFYSFYKLSAESFGLFFMHQANLFIMKNIAKRVGVDEKRMPISIDLYGNTGAATIPLTICNHYGRDGEKIVSERVLICGFGIGLSLGVGIIDLSDSLVLPIQICRDSFEDNIDNLHNETSSLIL